MTSTQGSVQVTGLSLVTGTLYPQHTAAPVWEVRSPTAVYDVLTVSIEQLEYLEALSGAIVEALEQSVASDLSAERARVLARLARSHSGHWLALLREDAEQRHPRAAAGQAGDMD